MKNKWKILIVTLMILSLVSCGNKNTEPVNNNSEDENIQAIDNNSQYDDLNAIFIFTNVDSATMSTDRMPSDFGAQYQIALKDENKLCSFNWSGEKYKKYGRYIYDYVETTEFSSEVFYEIKELIYQNDIEEYEYKFDENKKRVDVIEPYVIFLSYTINGKHHTLGIKTPDNIEEIISKLDDLIPLCKKNVWG